MRKISTGKIGLIPSSNIIAPHGPPHGNPQAPMAATTTTILLASTTAYPLLLRLVTGPHPTPLQYTTALKTTSTLHSLLTTTLSLLYLHQHPLPPHPPPSLSTDTTPPHPPEPVGRYPNDADNPIITTRSAFANAITSLETGYLIQDTLALLLQPRPRPRNKPTLSLPLLTHHLTLAILLLLQQHYVLRSRERGIRIIIQFLLMNASTPLLNLRWYLRTFAPSKHRAILATDVLFVAAFFAARIVLVGVVLREYGGWHGMGAWDVYRRGLRVPCQVGTGALVLGNLAWWGVMVKGLVRRLRRGGVGG